MIPKSKLEAVTTIVTHKDCPDGVASALILRDALPDRRIVFLAHGSAELRDFPAEHGQLWCDIVPPRERVKEFVDAGAIVLDHHRGARDIVEAVAENGVFADEEAEPGVSGALLAYREVSVALGRADARLESFAKLAGVRDTWQRDHED